MLPTILSIDTSSENIVISISQGNEILYIQRFPAVQSHSKKILGCIESSLQKINMQLSQINAFSTTIGPGSFTGLRTGLGTIKGFCFALQKPLIGIPTLYALAYPCRKYETVIPVLEAKKDCVYVAQYHYSKGTWNEDLPPKMISTRDLGDLSSTATFVGAACTKYKTSFPSTTKFGNSKFDYICGTTLSEISYRKFTKNELEDVLSIEPLYIQKTAAEGYV